MIRLCVHLILGCLAIGWSWLVIIISSCNFVLLGMYMRFFHFTSPSCLVQRESFFSNSSLANCSSLYCRLVICDVILIEATTLMDIGDKGGEKRVSGKRVCDLLSSSTPFQSLASWTEDQLGLFSWTMWDYQVIFPEYLLLSSLTAGEILGFMEELKVLVIH